MRGVHPLPSVWLTMVFFASSTNFSCSEVNTEDFDVVVVVDSSVFVLPMVLVDIVVQSLNCARHARSTSSSSNNLSVVKCPARAARDNALHFLLLRLLISAAYWEVELIQQQTLHRDKDKNKSESIIGDRE